MFKVNRITTKPYHPRSNGRVENHNCTLQDQLYYYVESRITWGIFLFTVQLMYNTTVNAATAYAPHYLMFGWECNMPAMGGMLRRIKEMLGLDKGMDDGTRRCMRSVKVLQCQL